jgi:hypothetical protein
MTGNDRSGSALPDLSEEPIRVIASYVGETAIMAPSAPWQ